MVTNVSRKNPLLNNLAIQSLKICLNMVCLKTWQVYETFGLPAEKKRKRFLNFIVDVASPTVVVSVFVFQLCFDQRL